LPVTHGTPPYGLYEHPTEFGAIPPHRTDTGAFLIAEVLGAKNCILVKNVDGLFTKDPFKYIDAKLISEITASELLSMDMEDMVLERMAVELLQKTVNDYPEYSSAYFNLGLAQEAMGFKFMSHAQLVLANGLMGLCFAGAAQAALEEARKEEEKILGKATNPCRSRGNFPDRNEGRRIKGPAVGTGNAGR
jgi:hypothetical protein